MLLKVIVGLVILSCCGVWASKDNENHTMTFEIVRASPPIEKFINFPSLFDEFSKGKGKGNRTNDSIALFRYLDNEFYGIVNIGKPAQIFNVAFDTTWGLSWVISSKCSSVKDVGCWFHNKYDHTKSSSYKKDGRKFVMDLGNFNMTGVYSYDNISIAHSNVTNQLFVEVTAMPNSYVISKPDGVLGLGLKVDDYNPFFYTLLDQKKIKDPIFSIYLNRDRQSMRGGNVMLGFVDSKHIHHTKVNNQSIPDPITYLSVENNATYWQFTVDKIVVISNTKGSENVTVCVNGCKAITDTSANSIVGPKDDVDQIHDAIGAREFYMNRYTVDCDTINKLPKISLILAGKPFQLSGEEYTVKMAYHSITMCLSAFVPANQPNEEGRWLLGGAFLASYYSVYDVSQKKVGFVKAN